MLKKCAMIAALSLVLLPGTARADWLFTPNIGAGFGGDSGTGADGEGATHLSWGASIGWMGAGILGWEADLACDLKVKNTDVYGYWVVKSGDSLSKIAKRSYDDAGKYMKIFEANKDVLKDPNVIKPGQNLKIPNL